MRQMRQMTLFGQTDARQSTAWGSSSHLVSALSPLSAFKLDPIGRLAGGRHHGRQSESQTGPTDEMADSSPAGLGRAQLVYHPFILKYDE